MAGYIGTQAVSVNTTSATISDDLSVGDDLTVTDDATIGGNLDVDGVTNLDVVDIDGQLTQQYAGGGDFIAVFQNTTAASPYGVMIKDAASGANGYPLFQVVDDDGSETHFKVQTGTGNVEIGAGSDFITKTLGTSNFVAGVNAGNSIASGGNYNVCVGDEAGTTITTGDFTVAVGFEAGKSVSTGQYNTLLGGRSGDLVSVGAENVAIGVNSLGGDTKGSKSVAVGMGTLQTQNFTSATNTFSTAVGYNAGLSVTSGLQNTLIGALAGDALTDADFNVAIGSQALTGDTLGSRSIAIGQHALQIQNFTSATEVYNVAVGYDAGVSVTTGIKNTLIGGLAGNEISTGSYNTFVGFSTGTYTVNAAAASSNVIVGAFSDTTAVNSNEAMGLGYNIDCAAGYTTLGAGASDIRAAHGNVTWATVSDQRYKKEIVDSTAGLSFINALQPRTFKYKNLGELPEAFSAYEADSTEVFKNSHTNHGFIAQEVKAAIDADSSIKDGFRLWDDREDGSQEVAEAALIPILVKAIQEQNALIVALTARITALEG